MQRSAPRNDRRASVPAVVLYRATGTHPCELVLSERSESNGVPSGNQLNVLTVLLSRRGHQQQGMGTCTQVRVPVFLLRRFFFHRSELMQRRGPGLAVFERFRRIQRGSPRRCCKRLRSGSSPERDGADPTTGWIPRAPSSNPGQVWSCHPCSDTLLPQVFRETG